MTAPAALLKSIQSSSTALTLAELLAQHPALARRTVQRWMTQWVAQGLITAGGEGRARRYTAPRQSAPVSANLPTDRFPLHTPPFRRQCRHPCLCRSAAAGAQAGRLPG